MVVPLLGLSLFLGLYPKPVLDRIEPTVEARDRAPRAEDRLPRARAAGVRDQGASRAIEAEERGRRRTSERVVIGAVDADRRRRRRLARDRARLALVRRGRR